MAKGSSPDQKIWLTLALFIGVFCLLSVSVFYGCKRLAISEAEKNLANFLLSHRAIRSFVEDVQKEEVYRLKDEGLLYQEYFSPKLLSSTFIARNIKDAQNRERATMGYEELYFKFASPNPRNPVNRADAAEEQVLQGFNRGAMEVYKDIVATEEGSSLYYAIPVARNRASCMLCHGDPDDAPEELLEQYGREAGFNEEIGDIRALMSVRVPLQGLLSEANRIAALISGAAFFLLAGAFGGVFGLLRKIDVQKRIAVENSAYLNTVMQSSSDTAIIAMDNDWRIKYANDAAGRLFKMAPGTELSGDLLNRIRHVGGEIVEKFQHARRIARERGDFRFTLEPFKRTLDAQLSTIAGPDGSGAGFLFIGQDISTRLLEDKEREQIKERLQKAEKMESIGLMAGGVAHDLNNILSGIINYPELLLMKLPEDSKWRGKVEAIRESGLRAAAVVADLLTVARGVASKKEVSDAVVLAEEYLQSPEYKELAAAHPKVDFSHSLPVHPMSIFCSPVHVKKCLMNLLSNAFEAVSSIGICRLEVGKQNIDAETARKFSVTSGEYCFFRVSDNGPGISADDLAHIFEPFYSTKKMGRSGTGLGLSVVWNTVKEHQGAVTVESNVQGSVFTLYFPLSTDRLDTDNEHWSLADLQGQQQKILVVDDEPHMRDIAGKMLKELNYRVCQVESGEDALLLLNDNAVDLVLLDMLMSPGLNGRQTYEAIIEKHPGQKAVIASGFSASEDVRITLEKGASGFLSKPYTIEQLGRVIKSTLG